LRNENSSWIPKGKNLDLRGVPQTFFTIKGKGGLGGLGKKEKILCLAPGGGTIGVAEENGTILRIGEKGKEP